MIRALRWKPKRMRKQTEEYLQLEQPENNHLKKKQLSWNHKELPKKPHREQSGQNKVQMQKLKIG